MNDNQVEVRIVGNTAGLAPAIGVAKGEIKGLEASIKGFSTSVSGIGDKIKGSLNGATSATDSAHDAMVRTIRATETETQRLRDMARASQETAEKINRIRDSIGKFAGVFAAAFAVKEVAAFSEKMGEAAEKVTLMSQRLGVTVGDVQRLSAMADLSQSSVEKMATGMTKLDKSLQKAQEGSKQQSAAFKTLGIDTDRSYTQMELMNVAMSKFATLDNGPRKVALAMDLFGKSGAELIPILSATKEQQEAFNASLNTYGVVNEGAVAKGNLLAEAWDTNALAVLGLQNVFTDALAPVLTSITDSMNSFLAVIIQSYNEGGVAADIFRVMTLVVEEVGAIVNVVGEIFGTIFGAVVEIVVAVGSAIGEVFGLATPSYIDAATVSLNVFKNAMIVIKSVVVIAVEIIKAAVIALVNEIRLFAVIARDAFTLNWAAIEGNWKAGLDRIEKDATKSATRIKAAWNEAGAAVGAAMRGEAPKATLPPGSLPKIGGSGIFEPTGGGGGKSAAAPKSDLVQKLDEALTAKKNAWEAEQNAQGTAVAFSLQVEADYWEASKSMAGLSEKDRISIEKKKQTALTAITKERILEVINGFKDELTEVGRNSELKLVILKREAAEIGRLFGRESKEYATAQREIVKAKREAAAQIKAIELSIADAARTARKLEVDAELETADFEVAMGVRSKAQLLVAERAHENKMYAINLQALNERLQLAQKEKDPEATRAAFAQIEALNFAHEGRLTRIRRQAELQRTSIARNAVTSIVSSWASSIQAMLLGQQSFGETIRQLWSGLVTGIVGAIVQMAQQWITQQLLMAIFGKALGATTAVSQITSNAAIAGSGAYAATAVIPIIGPALAPAAAATAFAGAMTFAALAAFDIGAWNLSKDMPAMVHAGEMIIPANIAGGVRSMMTNTFANDNAGNDNANAGPSGGDFHYHDHTERGMSPDMIMANRRAIAKAVQMAHREGHFAGKGMIV